MLGLPQTNGDINTTVEWDEYNRIQTFDYVWQGGPIAWSPPHWEAPKSAKPGDIVTIGQYRAVLLEQDLFIDGWLVQRYRPLSRLYVRLHWIVKPLWRTYRLMLVTLAVWGLADRHRESVPTWRDIRTPKRLARRRKNVPLLELTIVIVMAILALSFGIWMFPTIWRSVRVDLQNLQRRYSELQSKDKRGDGGE